MAFTHNLLKYIIDKARAKLKQSVDLPIVYSGGITTIDDIKELNKTNVEGIVIGSALYTNKIDLTEALKYQKRW